MRGGDVSEIHLCPKCEEECPGHGKPTHKTIHEQAETLKAIKDEGDMLWPMLMVATASEARKAAWREAWQMSEEEQRRFILWLNNVQDYLTARQKEVGRHAGLDGECEG